jgi:hypothetical protein
LILLLFCCILYSKKRFARDAHLADMKLVAAQHRSGAKESQATLCSHIFSKFFKKEKGFWSETSNY